MKTQSSQPLHHTLFCLALSLCVVLCQGCGNHGPATANGAGQKKLRLVFVANSPDDFWSVVRLGCDTATRNLGDVDLDFRLLTTPTAAAQQELITSLVAEGVDGIALSPIDPENQTAFLNGIAAKTLLACADSDAPASQRAFYVGIDNFSAGKQAAGLLKAALPQGGKVVVLVSYLKAQNIQDRIQGLKAGLSGSNIQIVDTVPDGAKTEAAQKNAEDLLAKYPDLAGIDCLNGYQGPAVLTAVRAAGKAGQVQIVCVDDYNDTLEGIAAGDIFGTINQPPMNIGYQTIACMDKYLHGDKSEITDGKVLLPSTMVTRKNVAEFQAARKAFLLKPSINP